VLRYWIFILSALFLLIVPTVQSAPDGYRLHRDLTYSIRGNLSLKADVYMPAKPGRYPGIITLHSGSWSRGSKARMSPLAALLSENGFVVMNINYRLAPKYKFPAALIDARSALAWFRSNAYRFGLDKNRIAIYGYSAGAHLALMLALSTEGTGPGLYGRVQAVIAGAAPSDLTKLPDSPTLRKLIGSSRAESIELYKRASPTFHVSRDDPPTLLYHGRFDWVIPVYQSRRLFQLLKESGVTVELRELNTGHGTTYFNRTTVLEHVLPFLKRILYRRNLRK